MLSQVGRGETGGLQFWGEVILSLRRGFARILSKKGEERIVVPGGL